jgi:general secretion pathway protein J
MLKQVRHAVGASGFTLLEMVVTLTILGFILLIIFGAFRLGISAWEKGESSREEYQKTRAVSQLISRQLKSIVPYKVKTEKAEGDYLAFEGKARSLKFVSALSMRTKQPEGFVYAIYEFKEGGSKGGRLVAYEQRVLIRKNFFEEDPKEESGVPLIEGVSDIRFEYYQEEDSLKSRKEGWVEEWMSKEQKDLPRAVRLTVTYKNGPSEKEEISMTLLASVAANRFEDLKPGASGGFVRRTIRTRPDGSN